LNLIEGLARLDLPDFELASRNDLGALGAFLEANGMTVVDPPGEYYDRHAGAFFFAHARERASRADSATRWSCTIPCK
jgi:hypothetical protein